MRVHQFTTAQLGSRPWKNGTGSTREIACWPPGSNLETFEWRASIATIAASGPFSAFPGVDRTIILLAGAGIHLRSGDGTIDHRLDTRLRPFSFSGDTEVECEMLDDESQDLNVMTRRHRLRAETRVLREGAVIEPAAHGVLLAVNGAWHAGAGQQTFQLAPGSGLWWQDGQESQWQLEPAAEGEPALVVACWRSRA